MFPVNTIDQNWTADPTRHFILQLGETGGRKWELFESYMRSSIKKRGMPEGNLFCEYSKIRPTSFSNYPEISSFSALTTNDRLDIVIHGSIYGPVDDGDDAYLPTNYTAKAVAERLLSCGLKEIGVLRLDSCHVGAGAYLHQLKQALTGVGIKFGYLSAPNGYLQAWHMPFSGVRPVYRLKFWEPWHVIKGNVDVRFPGTKYDF